MNFIVTVALGLGAKVHGAILELDAVERISAVVGTPVNLTNVGSLDWAYWAPNTGTGVAPLVAPTNQKIVGDAISHLDTIGGGSLRGSTSSTTVERYSWTDGTSPATGTTASLAGLIFNSQLGTSADGKGWKLTIAGDPAVERVVTLYLGAFAATGNLVLTLNGVASPITDSQIFPNAGPKHMDVYTLRFRPDALSDQLTVEYTASAITDATNGHVGLQAVTVSIIPEPGIAGLLGWGLAGLAFGRRRERRA